MGAMINRDCLERIKECVDGAGWVVLRVEKP